MCTEDAGKGEQEEDGGKTRRKKEKARVCFHIVKRSVRYAFIQLGVSGISGINQTVSRSGLNNSGAWMM